MSSFVIAELKVFDKKTFLEYKKLVPKTIEAFNGKIIASRRLGIALEGNWNPEKIIIIEFPSLEISQEWWSPLMYFKIREKSADTKIIVI